MGSLGIWNLYGPKSTNDRGSFFFFRNFKFIWCIKARKNFRSFEILNVLGIPRDHQSLGTIKTWIPKNSLSSATHKCYLKKGEQWRFLRKLCMKTSHNKLIPDPLNELSFSLKKKNVFVIVELTQAWKLWCINNLSLISVEGIK